MWLSSSGKVRRYLNQALNGDSKWSGGVLSTPIKQGALGVLNLGIGFAVPWASRNKFKVISMERGKITAKISLKGNKNHFGAMYAGALFTVAEIPGGVVALLNFDQKFYPILKEQRVEFKKVAKSDITVRFELSDQELDRIEREAEEMGRSEFTLEGELTDQDGEVVAMSYATYQVRIKD